MSDRSDARTVDQDLPAGWRRPPGSVWLVGAFRFPTGGHAASAGGAMATSLRALGLDGLAMRWAGDLLVVRIEAGPSGLPAELLAPAFAAVAGSVSGCNGEPVELGPASKALPPFETRDPRLAQATLHTLVAELLRLEAQLEDLAAEATAGAAGEQPDGGSRAYWGFLEAILSQLLVDDFGPLVEDLRAAAVWEPSGEPQAAERAA